MSFLLEGLETGGAVRLSGALTIYDAAEAKGPILHLLDGGERLLLDLSALREIDTAGMQLLLLLQREAHARGGGVEITDASEAVRDLMQLFGLDPHLMYGPGAPSP